MPPSSHEPNHPVELAPSSRPLEEVLTRTTEDLERLFRLWQASTYLWPTRAHDPQHAAPAGADRLATQAWSRSSRLSGHWQSVAQIENFGRSADRLATTMRRANRLDLATLYEGRAAQARQRAALLASFLTTLELAYAAIESYRAHAAQPRAAGPRMLHHVGRAAHGSESVVPERLTPREQQVAQLIALGFSNRQIADKLVISRGTVANHVAHILSKLGCRNRTEVAMSIYRFGEDGVHEASQLLHNA